MMLEIESTQTPRVSLSAAMTSSMSLGSLVMDHCSAASEAEEAVFVAQSRVLHHD